MRGAVSFNSSIELQSNSVDKIAEEEEDEEVNKAQLSIQPYKNLRRKPSRIRYSRGAI